MPPLYRLVEVGIYSLLNFLPLMVLALYPFRHRLRFSKTATVGLVVALSLVQIFLGWQAVEACKVHAVTPALEAICEANVYLSGVGADNVNCAAAHSFYNGVTSLGIKHADHGCCVALGTLVQLVLEGAPKEEFEEVQNFCLEVGLPVTLEEIGVTTPEQVETIAKNACIPGETIHNLAGDVQPIELYDAIMQADAMGKIALGK